MKAKELLEQDKERFMSKLGQDVAPKDGILVVEDELNRILYQYCTDETPAQTAIQLRMAFTAVKAALPLMDCVGEIRIYEQAREYPEKDRLKKEKSLLMTGSAAVLLLACILMAAVGKGGGFFVFLSLCLGGGALAVVFQLGRQKGSAANRTAGGKRKTEKYLDAEKVYHSLLTMMTVLDEGIEEAGVLPADNHEGQPAEEPEVMDSSLLDAKALSLYASLLESVYVSMEDAYAREVVSQIRFYLHGFGIEIEDYSPDRQQWFDLMPSLHEQTIRPALVHDGTLLSKGLATLKTSNS